MVYIDSMGHLAADSIDELHAFAAKIGLKREWWQDKGPLSHYDCTTASMRAKARRSGAVDVSAKEMPGIVRRMTAADGDDGTERGG